MKLEIECYHGGFQTMANWPEDDDGPGQPAHRISLLEEDNKDYGLQRISLHHKATRPKISKGGGHGDYRYRVEEQQDFEADGKIEVHGTVALILNIP